MPVTILHSENGDVLATAFQFLNEKKQSSVNIVVGNAAEIIKIIEDFDTRIDTSLLTPSMRWSSITNGHFDKWIPANSRLILRASDEVLAMLNGKDFPLEEAGSDNSVEIRAIDDGILSVKSKSRFWIGESLVD
jgi:hypothetical protein